MARADTVIACSLPLTKNALHSPTSNYDMYLLNPGNSDRFLESGQLPLLGQLVVDLPRAEHDPFDSLSLPGRGVWDESQEVRPLVKVGKFRFGFRMS